MEGEAMLRWLVDSLRSCCGNFGFFVEIEMLLVLLIAEGEVVQMGLIIIVEVKELLLRMR